MFGCFGDALLLLLLLFEVFPYPLKKTSAGLAQTTLTPGPGLPVALCLSPPFSVRVCVCVSVAKLIMSFVKIFLKILFENIKFQFSQY